MAKGEDILNTGSEVWNVAEGYVKIKILRPLILLDRYENIAKYGVEDLTLDIHLTENEILKNRIEALDRMIFTTKQLISNVLFAIKKGDHENITGFNSRIENCEEAMQGIYNEYDDEVTKERIIEIDEIKFKAIMKILYNIKTDLNIPINNAGLIFKTSDELDIDRIMNDIVQGG